MKVFRTIQTELTILGISPSNQLAQQFPFSKRVLLGFQLFAWLMASQFVYIFHVANGFMEYMECVCSMSAGIIVLVDLAAIVFRTTLLFESIDKIEQLIDTRCKYPKSKRFFLEINRQVEKMSEIVFMVVVKIALQFLILPKCIISYLVYFITDAGADSFQLPYPMWFPFDLYNPIGYLIAIIIEYIVSGYEFVIIACIFSIGIGAFLFGISIIKEIKHILHSINDKAKANETQPNELKLLFAEYIYTHAALKQLMHDFSDIFQPIFMSLFTWSLVAISGTLLIIQVEILHHGNVIAFLLLLLCGIFALPLVFIACELGQRMTDSFDEINFSIDQLKWYLFGKEIKRMLPMIIANAHQTVSIECFGSITCTRDVFKNIIHCAFSYFMVLRHLDN